MCLMRMGWILSKVSEKVIWKGDWLSMYGIERVVLLLCTIYDSSMFRGWEENVGDQRCMWRIAGTRFLSVDTLFVSLLVVVNFKVYRDCCGLYIP